MLPSLANYVVTMCKKCRLAWATDIHLNFIDGDVGPFCDLVAQTGAGGLVITGDISEAKTIEQYLAAIESRLSLPIYFVLGNHDFYNGSIAAVRKTVAGLCRRSRRLHYLSRRSATWVARSPLLWNGPCATCS